MSNLGNMNDLINKLSDAKFEYAKNDCFTFTAALVKAWHGKDYLKHHIKAYKSKKTALEYMEQFRGIEALAIGTLGYPVNPEHCKDGDVVIAEVAPGEIALGFVFNGHGLFKGVKKIGRIKLSNCKKGWRIR